MSNKSLRINTNIGSNDDKYVKFSLEQEFDFLEILSLKITDNEVYTRFDSEFGAVVGRVIMNSGVGVPNARVSIFIPISEEDKQNDELFRLYPYETITDTNFNGVRYNLLPNKKFGDACYTPVGTFPTKNEILDNPILMEIHEKYYKYTATTNDAGDFMLFGVPVGEHLLHVDVDISDMGIYSQKPHDLIDKGAPLELFESVSKFKKDTNLDSLPQVKTINRSVRVLPFWSDKEHKDIGITRVDMDLNYKVEPKAVFMGSIFGDTTKNSINKNCRPRKKMGRLSELTSGSGLIQMIRKTTEGLVERFDVNGGDVIDDNGAWAYSIPMNLDYMVTDEEGNLIPSDNPNKGIPTRSKVRFRIGSLKDGGEGRTREKGTFLVPNNPKGNTIDYTFDERTSDDNFVDLYWNKLYTVKSFIPRFQKNTNIKNDNFTGIKRVNTSESGANPFPFNSIKTRLNALFSILCVIITIIINIISFINKLLGAKIHVGGRFLSVTICIFKFAKIKAINMKCPGDYPEGCSPDTTSCSHEVGVKCTKDNLLECYRKNLAEVLGVFQFDFYNDWVNGSIYIPLFKKRRDKYCGQGNGADDNHLIDARGSDFEDDYKETRIDGGILFKFEDEMFYKPIKDSLNLFKTDILNLGSIIDCDWQNIYKIQNLLDTSSYELAPTFTGGDDSVYDILDLYLKLKCTDIKITPKHSNNVYKSCEIGVAIPEDRDDDPNDKIGNSHIEDGLVRAAIMKYNEVEIFKNLNRVGGSSFRGDYDTYRNFNAVGSITQSKGGSFYFYFGLINGNSALDLLNKKYFTECVNRNVETITIIERVKHNTSVGGSEGEIYFRVLNGSEDYEIKINNKIISEQKKTGLPKGNYKVKVYDNVLKVSTEKNITVRGVNPISIILNTIRTTTTSSRDGGFTIVKINGGKGLFNVKLLRNDGTIIDSYSDVKSDINFGVVKDVNNGFLMGTYTIQIEDGYGNNFKSDYVLGLVTPLEIYNHSVTPPTCESSVNVINFRVKGGIPPYDISYTLGGKKYGDSITENTNLELEVNHPDNPSDTTKTHTLSIKVKDNGDEILEGRGKEISKSFTLKNGIKPSIYRQPSLIKDSGSWSHGAQKTANAGDTSYEGDVKHKLSIQILGGRFVFVVPVVIDIRLKGLNLNPNGDNKIYYEEMSVATAERTQPVLASDVDKEREKGSYILVGDDGVPYRRIRLAAVYPISALGLIFGTANTTDKLTQTEIDNYQNAITASYFSVINPNVTDSLPQSVNNGRPDYFSLYYAEDKSYFRERYNYYMFGSDISMTHLSSGCIGEDIKSIDN
jgi:hypothetical protein